MEKNFRPKVVEFCCGRRRCPVVEVKDDEVIVGGEKEGFSTWSKDNLRDFVKAAKEGKFDSI